MHNQSFYLDRRKKYLQIALNSTPSQARRILSSLPKSPQIIYEAGTPLLKEYGVGVVNQIQLYAQARSQPLIPHVEKAPSFLQRIAHAATYDYLRQADLPTNEVGNGGPYVVADMKCADRAEREVHMAAANGAQAATVLGSAPLATVKLFVEHCRSVGIDSYVDMIGVQDPVRVLGQLPLHPSVVVLHRGVDELNANSDGLPLFQIRRIKSLTNNTMIAVAGADDAKAINSALFNDADIVIVWRDVYEHSGDLHGIVAEHLKNL